MALGLPAGSNRLMTAFAPMIGAAPAGFWFWQSFVRHKAAALKQFGPRQMLPVFNRADSDQALGTLHIEDVFRTYGVSPRRKTSWAEPEPVKLEEQAE